MLVLSERSRRNFPMRITVSVELAQIKPGKQDATLKLDLISI